MKQIPATEAQVNLLLRKAHEYRNVLQDLGSSWSGSMHATGSLYKLWFGDEWVNANQMSKSVASALIDAILSGDFDLLVVPKLQAKYTETEFRQLYPQFNNFKYQPAYASDRRAAERVPHT